MAKGDKGKVVQVIGTVVDVGFDQNQLPEIFHALELENEGERLVCLLYTSDVADE